MPSQLFWLHDWANRGTRDARAEQSSVRIRRELASPVIAWPTPFDVREDCGSTLTTKAVSPKYIVLCRGISSSKYISKRKVNPWPADLAFLIDSVFPVVLGLPLHQQEAS